MSAGGLDPQAVIRRLRGLQQLAHNDAWQEILAPHLAAKLKEHQAGVAKPGVDASLRTEHVQAVHTMLELNEWLTNQTQFYQRQYDQFTDADKKRAEGTF